MNEAEETCDEKRESCSSVSSEFQLDEQNASETELQPMRFTVSQGINTQLNSQLPL